MAQDNRGYYPTDSLNQEQTEFYNEYPPYQYNNDTNHYHDEGLFAFYLWLPCFRADQSFPIQIPTRLLRNLFMLIIQV